MCPSCPAFAIHLGPTNPSLITIAKETLFFRRAGISPALRLLVPTFSLPIAPPWLTPSASSQMEMLSYHSYASLKGRTEVRPRTDQFWLENWWGRAGFTASVSDESASSFSSKKPAYVGLNRTGIRRPPPLFISFNETYESSVSVRCLAPIVCGAESLSE